MMKTSILLPLIALALAPASPALAAAEQESSRRIAVSGHETVRIPATRARLTAVVEVQEESPTAAQQTVRERSRAVLQYLETSNVDRLQAGAMALYPIYGEHQPGPMPRGGGSAEQVVGYRAQWNATFEIAAERAGELVDGVVEAGAARISNFEFNATDEALAEAQRQAVRAAVVRARDDAHAILDALGYRPGEVVKIDVQSGGPIRPLAHRAEMMSAFAADRASPPTAVEPGLIEVNGTVSIEVGY